MSEADQQVKSLGFSKNMYFKFCFVSTTALCDSELVTPSKTCLDERNINVLSSSKCYTKTSHLFFPVLYSLKRLIESLENLP